MVAVFVGDVVSSIGCKALLCAVDEIKKRYSPDIFAVNGENSADGNGILPDSASLLFGAGADVITGGNHTFKRREIYSMLDENPFLLRCANYPDSAPGKGIAYIDKGAFTAAVINICGTVYMQSLECPFKTAEKLVNRAKSEGAKYIFVDFHAEATSEKRAMGHFLDGKVTAVVGTHTHIPTADATVLPGGTAYITDLGMTGPENSVLGVDADCVLKNFIDKTPQRFITAKGNCVVQGAAIDINPQTGLATGIEGFSINISEERLNYGRI